MIPSTPKLHRLKLQCDVLFCSVIQRHLVFVVGLSNKMADIEVNMPFLFRGPVFPLFMVCGGDGCATYGALIPVYISRC